MPYKDPKKAAEQRRRWKQANPDKVKASDKASTARYKAKERGGFFDAYLRRQYGLEREVYDQMLQDQGGACAICRGPSKGRFYVDHDHQTGKVRGLLCHSCNVLLGHAKDQVEVLEAAIFYLKKNHDHLTAHTRVHQHGETNRRAGTPQPFGGASAAHQEPGTAAATVYDH